jgi:hypothetical protein
MIIYRTVNPIEDSIKYYGMLLLFTQDIIKISCTNKLKQLNCLFTRIIAIL